VRITIFGMGYVGVVSAACLVRDGHEVVGVDPVEPKVLDLCAGRSPIQEREVAGLLAAGHQAGRLKATTEPAGGLAGCEMVWVCVGTPSKSDGSVNMQHIETAAAQIGDYLRDATQRPLVVFRSTVPPGTTERCVIPIIAERSGLNIGRDVDVVFHPEFLREGSAVRDFDDPPKIVVGEQTPGAADPLLDLYANYTAPRFRLQLAEAELVKYCDNLFHAVKVTFANEIGALARDAGVDARRVAEVFCADTKLNISPAYLRPGFAYGGSCLPKDLGAILRHASLKSLSLPLLQALPVSNAQQIDALCRRILTASPASVGLVGLAFKPGTDDMRESPYVAVAKRLIGEGCRVRIYDPGVQVDRLIGSNKAAVQAALRHLESLLVGNLDDLNDVHAVVINHPTVDAAQVNAWLARGVRVFDLAGVTDVDRATAGYEGIAW